MDRGETLIGEVIAGIGLRPGCDAAAIVAVVRNACTAIGRQAVVLAVPAFRRQEPGVFAAARQLDLELIFIDKRALKAVESRCVSHSTMAETTVGVSSVAEGCALAAAGPRSRLLLPRLIGQNATCAIAERE